MNYKTALKIINNESKEETAERIVELYETISQLDTRLNKAKKRNIKLEDMISWLTDGDIFQMETDYDIMISELDDKD